MSFLLFLVIVISLTVLPIMISAKVLRANKTSFKTCLITAIGAVAVETFTRSVIVNPGFAGLVALIICGILFSLVLETGYKKGFIISLLALGVQLLLGYALTGIGLATGTIEITN